MKDVKNYGNLKFPFTNYNKTVSEAVNVSAPVNRNIKTVEKNSKSCVTEKSKQEMNLLYKVCPELNEQNITEEEIMRLKRDVEEKLENNEKMLSSLTLVYSFIK